MPADPDLQKHTLNLRRGDYDWLRYFCADKDIKASKIIQSLVSKGVDRLKAAHESATPTANPDQLDLDL